MERHFFLMEKKKQYESVYSPKVVIFHEIPIKLRLAYILYWEKSLLKFPWNQKRARIPKAILGNKTKTGDITILHLFCDCFCKNPVEAVASLSL